MATPTLHSGRGVLLLLCIPVACFAQTDLCIPGEVRYKSGYAVILRVGQNPDRVWHFWSTSPPAGPRQGHLESCTVKARVRISHGALLQPGMDYWCNPTIGFGRGGNNHETGASNRYFPSARWQEAVFRDKKIR